MDFQTQLARDYHHKRWRYYVRITPLALLLPIIIVMKSSEERTIIPFVICLAWIGVSFSFGFPLAWGVLVGYGGMVAFFLILCNQRFRSWKTDML